MSFNYNVMSLLVQQVSQVIESDVEAYDSCNDLVEEEMMKLYPEAVEAASRSPNYDGKPHVGDSISVPRLAELGGDALSAEQREWFVQDFKDLIEQLKL